MLNLDKDKSDRYTVTYTFWTGMVFLWILFGNDLDRIFHLYLFLIPIIGVPALFRTIALIVALGIQLWKRRWRRAISVVVAPFAAWFFFSALIHAGITFDWIHLELEKSSYMRDVTLGKSRAWIWGSTGGATGPDMNFTVIYDDNDQMIKDFLIKSNNHGSNPVSSFRGDYPNLDNSPLYPGQIDVDCFSIERLDKNFYLVTQIYASCDVRKLE